MNYATNDYNWVESVPLSNFSNKALIIASRFARALRSSNGNQIQLQDRELAKKIVIEVSENNDPKLRKLFDELVAELSAFAETRGQARYRGTVQTSDGSDNVTKGETSESKTVMYRGVEVVKESKEPVETSKKRYYRGVEI